MGRRKISFDPPAITFVSFIVMYVSDCGPHSFETSTFVPYAIDCVAPPAASAPPFWMYWYLSHQVGSFGSSPACADEVMTNAASAAREVRFRMMTAPGAKGPAAWITCRVGRYETLV